MATPSRRPLGLDVSQPPAFFATWALSQPGGRIEDVSRLMGHSSVRITQDIYVSPDGDLFKRFFELTK